VKSLEKVEELAGGEGPENLQNTCCRADFVCYIHRSVFPQRGEARAFGVADN
jgi:hypothetical protein